MTGFASEPTMESGQGGMGRKGNRHLSSATELAGTLQGLSQLIPMTAPKGATTRSLGASKWARQDERPGEAKSNAPTLLGEKARKTQGEPATHASSPHHPRYKLWVLWS